MNYFQKTHIITITPSNFAYYLVSYRKSTKIILTIEYNSLYLHHKIISKNETE